MEIATSQQGGIVAVTVTGDVDLLSREELGRSLADAVRDADQGVEVDLSGVDFLDSSGMSTLLTGRRAADEAGLTFRVVAAGDLVRRVMVLTGVWPLLTGQAHG
ncbi:anti-sigma B factor antagonist [Hamadaea flava]|uniref:STAS domain-containing protein n=1 Tax=Hamadaea flava TaxID=1742688 RepID=A0ABV8LYF7_9ACTN|nr:STAS domain-containing protein [Hamadaea flava]MCP2329006.1 anti-sigma B factor antagonist [Hamadaea flava]